MCDIWNVILYEEIDNRLLTPENNPKQSGVYLCTCIKTFDGVPLHRYMAFMGYDSMTKSWHDVGNKSGISHTILAWTDKVEPCMLGFDEFNYIPGGILTKKKLRD